MITSSSCIQLFRQRLSYESVKAYATMPIGIVGSKSLALLYWGSRRFSNKGREKTNTCLCCFLPPRWNTLRFTQATVKTTITRNNFRHYRVSFSPLVRQPLSKQLYTKSVKEIVKESEEIGCILLQSSKGSFCKIQILQFAYSTLPLFYPLYIARRNLTVVIQ